MTSTPALACMHHSHISWESWVETERQTCASRFDKPSPRARSEAVAWTERALARCEDGLKHISNNAQLEALASKWLA